jgi:hypothetical protein
MVEPETPLAKGLLTAMLALSMVGCSQPAAYRPPVTASPRRSVSMRRVTRPYGARVRFIGPASAVRRLRQAEHDLKAVRLWWPLTHHLFEVKVAVRSGRSDIPPDRHLADAYTSALEVQGTLQNFCDVVFYPAAITQDLARWRRLHAQGRLGRPPAGLRPYWGALLAHELGHCRGTGKGERVANLWEGRALHRLDRGSQT